MYRLALIIILVCISCTHPSRPVFTGTETSEMSKNISYLAMGDSYTYGQGVAVASSFPFLLKSRLEKDGYVFAKEPEIVARTGWTCDNLYRSLDALKFNAKSFNLITLLCGVNDQYQKYGIDQYPINFTKLVEQAINLCGDKDKIVIISIPDYSVTPFGQAGNALITSKELEEYNKINKSIALGYGIKYVNITDISLKGKNDLSYLASDKLHPSPKMYEEWVSAMYSSVIDVLKN
jgi:lysophospholipase L1-like esterase